MIGQLTIDRRFHAAVRVENVGTYLIGGNSDNNPTTTDFLAHGLTEWTTGPNIPVSMATPCAVRISKLSFVAILNNDILEYQVDVADPTSSSGWQLPNPWPSLQTSLSNLDAPSLITRLSLQEVGVDPRIIKVQKFSTSPQERLPMAVI